ncbi:glycosyl hydrolase [Cellulophaga baltica]|uniref:glycosyl hydrolase n=1 Tax=Cellulophaga baltica TaxID=76594 RepID=UPI0037C95807
MRIFTGIAFLLVSSVFYGQTPEVSKDKKWVLVPELSDEFDQDILDTTKWQKEPIGNDWVWDGRPPALFKASNVTVKDGKLNVTVGKLDQPVTTKGKVFTHQGGIVRSLNPGKVGYYYEAKMKANKTVMSSTFWLMSKYDCEQKLELDIQECVGRTTDKTEVWAQKWDQIFHANAIHRKTTCNPEAKRVQQQFTPETKNHERFYVYGAWWKSDTEILFYLDGTYTYTLNPTVAWNVPAYIHMAIETYDWNPIPDDGGLVTHGTLEERTTQYEWVRTWELK